MKIHNFILPLLTLCVTFLGYAQDNCDAFYPMQKGAKFQITNYNAKDKPSSVVDYEVQDVQEKSEGKVATINVKIAPKKGSPMEQNLKMICKDNIVSIDFSSLLDQNMIEQFEQFDIDFKGNDIQWFSNLSVGQELPDANVTMDINVAGMNMSTQVDIIDRKVIGKEKLTTPAGTFDCYIVTHSTKIKTMGTTMETSSKTWVANGVGMVKEETYRKNKLDSYSTLTAFSR